MNNRTILAALAAMLALGALTAPAAAQTRYQERLQYQGWQAPTFPWQKRYNPVSGPTNQAAINGDAAIRWQSIINSYARGH